MRIMKLSCLQENLANALAIVARAAQSRVPLPILGHVLLATDKGRLRLQATNLEMMITVWMGAKVDAEGAITVPCRTIADWVKQLPPERIDLEMDARTCTLRLQCARTHANIKGIDAKEFPLPEGVGDKTWVRLEPDVLKQCITETAFAAATDTETRPVLAGVALEFGKERITFAAADGFRLSIRQAEAKTSNAKTQKVIVPLACVHEVARVFAAEEDHVTLRINETGTRIEFRGESVTVSSQLIDGRFPDYSRILPQGYKTRALLDRAELLEAVEASSVFARESLHALHLQLEAGDEKQSARLLATATSQEAGDSLVHLQASLEGEAVDFGLDARYLKQALSAMASPQVALELNGPGAAVALKPVGDDNAVHVIMPQTIAHETRTNADAERQRVP